MNPIHNKREFEIPLPESSGKKRHKMDFSHINSVPDKGWFDYPVSVCTDELNFEKSLLKLRKRPILRDTIIGVSGLFTLDLAVQRGDLSLRNVNKINNIIIIDCSLRVWNFWYHLGKIVRRCKLRATVIARIKTLIREQALYYYSKHRGDSYKDAYTQIKTFQQRIDLGLSWLSTEDYFQAGKKLFGEYRIYTVLSDLNHPKTLNGVIKELESCGHTVDTLYTSSIFSSYRKKEALKDAFIIQASPFPVYCCGKHFKQKVFTTN